MKEKSQIKPNNSSSLLDNQESRKRQVNAPNEVAAIQE